MRAAGGGVQREIEVVFGAVREVKEIQPDLQLVRAAAQVERDQIETGSAAGGVNEPEIAVAPAGLV